MGVQLTGLIPTKEIEILDLSGKLIGIDALNWAYQFLSIIRDRMTGEPLKNSKGVITSHLSGILYRNASLIENGIKPAWVFDGERPEFKKKTLQERESLKQKAEIKWKEALEKGEPAIKYAQATSKFTGQMIEDSKKLLDYMGIPWVQAKSEGEAQMAVMGKSGDLQYAASQDWDSILFGSPRLVRNLSISGRKKLPNKEVYVDVKPQLIELENVLKILELTREQLIMLGLLIGTDYNEGIKGVGPKTALKLVKEHKTLGKLLTAAEFSGEVDIEMVYNFFLNPPYTDDYELNAKEPDAEGIMEFMVEEHDFSRERIEKVAEKLQASYAKGRQASLKGWVGK